MSIQLLSVCTILLAHLASCQTSVPMDGNNGAIMMPPPPPPPSALCFLCMSNGSSLVPEWMATTEPPLPLILAEQAKSDGSDIADMIVAGSATNTSCGEWQAYAATLLTSNSSECIGMQNWLMSSCCDGLPPFYTCQQSVKDFLFPNTTKYDPTIGPSSNTDDAVNVASVGLVQKLTVDNPGWMGGSVFAEGQLIFSWKDERLMWDPADFGCAETWVRASLPTSGQELSDIWIPSLDFGDVSSLSGSEISNTANVQSDGTVTWYLPMEQQALCTTVPLTNAKRCTSSIGSPGRSSRNYQKLNFTNFIPPDAAALDNIIPGYKLDPFESVMEVVDGNVELSFFLEPSVPNCPLCGGIEGVILRESVIPTSQNIENGLWVALQPDQVGYSCQQLDDFLSENFNTAHPVCQAGRGLFFDACCQRLDSRHECEQNLQNHALGDGNLQELSIAPDLSRGTVFDNYTKEELQKTVAINMDFEQLLSIDIKSNTMQLLVSLELFWIDDSLAWDPFIGSCYLTSYRASLDPEQTQIWVPEIDLMNQVEGTQNLPTSHASVFYSGFIWWRRTGVLTVACELTGIRMFPFDRPSCYLDFGTSRDPAFHPVNYTFETPIPRAPVEFSQRLIDKLAEYQEYEVETEEYLASIETSELSGYLSRRIRFQFFFNRAKVWYLISFVILYVMFTYLSFGMFLLDHQVGERLAYGTSILFVMLAQDITMSAYTPIAHVRLWIEYIALASKAWVMGGILESLVIIYVSIVVPTLKNENLEEGERSTTDSVSNVSEDDDCFSEVDVDEELYKLRHGRRSMLGRRPPPTEPKALQRYKRLRNLDILMLRFFTLSYTVFLIVMSFWAGTADRTE